MALLLVQMSLWYQWRPLALDEETLIAVQLADDAETDLTDVTMKADEAVEVLIGPFHAVANREVLWKAEVRQEGRHTLQFDVGDEQVSKELVAGRGYIRINPTRVGKDWREVLSHPAERPFGRDSAVRSISVTYPDRMARLGSTPWWMKYAWLIHFCLASIVFGFIFAPVFKVKI